MNGPKHLSIDRDDTVLIADTENHRIVRFNPKENTLTAVAGIGKKGAIDLVTEIDVAIERIFSRAPD